MPSQPHLDIRVAPEVEERSAIAPRQDPLARPLVRVLHSDGRRHCYSLGAPSVGTVIQLLGCVGSEPTDERDRPVWLSSEGLLSTPDLTPSRSRARPLAAVRWASSPLRWKDWATRRRRLGQVGRRLIQTPRYVLAGPPGGIGRIAVGTEPDGYLHTTPGTGRLALFAATHAATGDQLLTLWPAEAAKLGYEEAVEIGYVVECSAEDVGLHGVLAVEEVRLPWTWRQGERVRTLHRRTLPPVPIQTKPEGEAEPIRTEDVGEGPSADEKPPLPAPPRRSPAHGTLNPEIHRGCLRGWARTGGGSHRAAIVELVVDGEVVDTDTADRSHATVGRFGYAFPLPPAAFERGTHELRARVRGDEQFLGDPIIVSNQYHADQPLQSALQSMELNLAVEGWVYDRAAPEERFTAGVFIDTTWIADVECTRKRVDLERKGFSDGHLGYRMEIPQQFFDREDHRVHVLILGRNVFAKNSGRVFDDQVLTRGLVRRIGRRLAYVEDLLG